MDDDRLLATIKKQNKIKADKEEFYMKIVKKLHREKKNGSQSGRAGIEEGCIIIEADEDTYD